MARKVRLCDSRNRNTTNTGLSDRIRWHEADMSKPLGYLGLETSYDVVLANWVFDHADSIEVLERIFGSTTSYLKPGGRLICVHIENLRSPLLSVNKYGFSGSSLENLYGESFQIYEKFGLENAQRIPLEDTELVRNDMEFWKEFVEQPILRFVTAQKRIE
ncbi:hypothetical protein VM1G_11522 [Cytospora mali]|uniref:Methyltransferase type 11 domain-containing protein n=1 Tax=Cytospora mali TaxID=578113 RepID=A0A194VUU3_CYTMA|nr:hypothetical protein VM1G_11522 [Valsa mali]